MIRTFVTARPQLAAALFLLFLMLACWLLFGAHPAGAGLMAVAALGNIMSPEGARVIDPVLTNVARGYQNTDMVGRFLFPTVPVSQRGGKIITFGKEDFMAYNTVRAPGSSTRRVQFGYSGSPYSLLDHSLEGQVPIENMQEAEAVPGINLGMNAVRKTQNIIALSREVASAGIARDPGNYPTANKMTVSGSSGWLDYANSDPSKDIEAGLEQVRTSIGRRPNTILLPARVLSGIRYHPKLLDRIKYTGRDSITAELLAALWQVPNVVVGGAVQAVSEDAPMSDVWGNDVILAYTELGTLADGGLPSYGYTYQLSGYPIVEQPYLDRNNKSWIYPVTDVLDPVVASGMAGFLIQNAVPAAA